MLRQITVILLLLAFVAQTFSGQFILLDYYANTSAFAKNCINKAKPKMHCNGKCQVMKKMQEEEKKDQQNTAPKYGNKILVLSSGSYFDAPLTHPTAIFKENTCYTVSIDLQERSFSFFQPPR